MMNASPQQAAADTTTATATATVTFCERNGDRALVLAQRLLESITHAPEIEEDMALSNISLDLIGQARALYTYAGQLEAQAFGTPARSEDAFAYFRDADQFVNPLLVEQPNGDFAHLIVRQFLHDAYAVALWQQMTASTDETLAAIAVRAAKETAYHLRHSRSWVVRLGDGTEESHVRTQAAIDAMWTYTDELFERDAVDDELIRAGVTPSPDALRATWTATVADALDEATLTIPDGTAITVEMATGGRHGAHTDGFEALIGEMQVLARAHPGARW